MDNILKGNFETKKKVSKKQSESDNMSKEVELNLETNALEKLCGSIAFVKKSAKFVWKGN